MMVVKHGSAAAINETQGGFECRESSRLLLRSSGLQRWLLGSTAELQMMMMILNGGWASVGCDCCVELR